MGSENKSVESEIRKLIDARVAAVRAKDVEGSTAHIAPDIMAFDVVNPLRFAGADAEKKRVEEWFSSFAGPIGCEVRDLSIATGGDVAFSHQPEPCDSHDERWQEASDVVACDGLLSTDRKSVDDRA